ncbi:Receptor-like serine/threonine-protein kinase-like protein [Drosera capensis]
MRKAVLALYITVATLAFIASKVLIAVLLYKRWKRKQLLVQEKSGGNVVIFRSTTTKSLKPDAFLKKTMKLSNKDIIGSGGYGTVYKLRVNDSVAFAVKRLNRGSADRDKGFERELEAMGDIKHKNIVTLHGYCTSPYYNLLIYELMANGSLDAVLHGNAKKRLDWSTRYKIAVGAARGLSYLHHDCIPHIIHRDIKSSNILLDDNMEARVSDFGLATLMEPDQTHVSTFVAGTFGYLAPEYFDTGKATVKGDVYSFGVVLLELLTGKKPMDEEFLEEGTKLVTWVKTVLQQRREDLVIDRSLESCPIDEVNKVFNIALMCLESDPSKRPTMADVVKMLEYPGKYFEDAVSEWRLKTSVFMSTYHTLSSHAFASAKFREYLLLTGLHANVLPGA